MNDFRKSRRLLIGFLFAATLSMDLAVGRFVARQHVADEASLGFVVYEGLALAQLAVLASWLVHGRGTSVVRLATVLIAVWILTWPLPGGSASPFSRAFFVLGTYLMSVTVPLAAMRLCGYRLKTRVAEPSQTARSITAGPQFSLSSIVAWTTAVCLMLGILPHAGFHGHDFGQVLCYVAPFTFAAFANYWSVFVGRHPYARWILPFLVCPLISGLMGTNGYPEFGFQSFAGITLTASAYLCLSLNLLHNLGVRFVRANRLPIHDQPGVHTMG